MHTRVDGRRQRLQQLEIPGVSCDVRGGGGGGVVVGVGSGQCGSSIRVWRCYVKVEVDHGCGRRSLLLALVALITAGSLCLRSLWRWIW